MNGYVEIRDNSNGIQYTCKTIFCGNCVEYLLTGNNTNNKSACTEPTNVFCLVICCTQLPGNT